jgi:hypothetical protein
MTFYRLVPAWWELVKAEEESIVIEEGGAIAPGETTVTITANVNLKWYGQATDNTAGGTTGDKAYSDVPTAYTTNAVDVVVPARPADEADSWTSQGTATIKIGHDGATGVPAVFPVREITFNRPAYTLNVDVTGKSLTTVTLDVSTTAPDFALELKERITGELVGSMSGSGGEQTINISGNKGTSEREICVINKVTGVTVTTFIQLVSTQWSVAAPGSSCPNGYTRYNSTNFNLITGNISVTGIYPWSGTVTVIGYGSGNGSSNNPYWFQLYSVSVSGGIIQSVVKSNSVYSSTNEYFMCSRGY